LKPQNIFGEIFAAAMIFSQGIDAGQGREGIYIIIYIG
jgi:hypothetical protein